MSAEPSIVLEHHEDYDARLATLSASGALLLDGAEAGMVAVAEVAVDDLLGFLLRDRLTMQQVVELLEVSRNFSGERGDLLRSLATTLIQTAYPELVQP